MVVTAFKEAKLLEAEMLCLLLERMELSDGFNQHEKKSHRPHTSNITLLPSRAVVKALASAKEFLSARATPIQITQKAVTPKKIKRTISAVKTVEPKPEYHDLIEKHKPVLQRVFTYYCSFGEPMNSTNLKSSKFIKLLKDSGIMADTS